MEPDFIPWAQPQYWGREREYVNEALASTWISGGPFVERLEAQLRAASGSAHALATSNGTTAIHLAYLGAGVKAGDEIVVPGFGFLAAANVALHMGAVPVFCDVDPDTWCMRAEDVERVLSPRTRAIVPVHTYGNVCAMDPIMDLARQRGIVVIEDAAEAFPSRYDGKLAGSIADLGTFSFHATKTVTTGEGGLVLTNSDEVAERMALYRSHGLKRKRHYWHEAPGHNFRLTNLQAALGCAQLEQLDRIVAERARLYASYTRRLAQVPGLTLQRMTQGADPVVWAVGLRLAADAYPQGRDAVLQQMHELGIELRPGFYAASQLDLYKCRSLPVSEVLASSIVSLPSYPAIDDERIERICSSLASLARRS